MSRSFPQGFSSVYGPVASWRYGRSLGIDPIGAVSTCSFDCVYCQLGAIEDKTRDRRVFVATSRILRDLQGFPVASVDVITLSGSGEPTLARNLGEIVSALKAATGKLVVVLTNASLLGDPQVRRELALADFVAAKVDAAGDARLRRVDRPVEGIGFAEIRRGLLSFRREYQGLLAVQTMLLGRWPDREQADYIAFINELAPDANAFVHRNASLDLFAWAFWTFDSTRQRALDWLDAFGRIAGAMGNGRRYQNYPRRGNPDFREQYFGENLDRLMAVKQHYDPHNLFAYEQGLLHVEGHPRESAQ